MCCAEFSRLPGQIERIDRNAVPAQARPGIERHEPEWFCLRCGDHFPDVDAHGRVNDFQFIYEGDVDAAENVLEKLGSFRNTARRNRHDGLDRPAIKLHRLFEASRRQASDELRNVADFAVGIGRVFAFRREGQMEILASREPGSFLEHGAQILVGRAWIGGRFQDHQRALLQMGGDRASGFQDIGDIGFAVLVERRRHANNNCFDLVHAREIRAGFEPSRVYLFRNRFRRNMSDVASAYR